MQRVFHTLFIFFFLTACATQPALSTPKPVDLVPYMTATQPAAPQLTPEGLVPLKTPLPTSTPFTYSVKSGDTISSIALEFGVSIDELVAANPEVSPSAMSIGTVLKIPSNPDNPSGEPTPTPAPFTVEQIECYPTSNQGMWCFVLVHNDYFEFMENVSAQVALVDANENFLASQIALLPLNHSPAKYVFAAGCIFSARHSIGCKTAGSNIDGYTITTQRRKIFASDSK